MTSDEPADDNTEQTGSIGADDGAGVEVDADSEGGEGTDAGARKRLERGADRAVSEFDEGHVDLLAWLLDTETRARIYVYLRQQPGSTSEEVAGGTGLYPSTVREALADLNDEGTVTRRKREHDGAGNNPYAYTAIAPSDLVRNVAGQVQSELNTVFNLDDRLGNDDPAPGVDDGPVSITVGGERTAGDESANGNGSGDSSGDVDDTGATEDDSAA